MAAILTPDIRPGVSPPLLAGRTSLRTHLSNLVRSRGWTARIEQQRAVALWPQIAGPAISRRTSARSIQSEVLWVEVTDAVWATQLTFLKTDLLKKLRAAGATSLRDLRFRVATFLPQGERPPAPVAPQLPLRVEAPPASLPVALQRMRAAAERRSCRFAVPQRQVGPK